jgi:hypothetical protein
VASVETPKRQVFITRFSSERLAQHTSADRRRSTSFPPTPPTRTARADADADAADRRARPRRSRRRQRTPRDAQTELFKWQMTRRSLTSWYTCLCIPFCPALK